MATNYRAAAIRGQRAVTDYPGPPTPFAGGDVSGGAIFAKVGLGLIAHRRAQVLQREAARQAALKETQTLAQIGNLKDLARHRDVLETQGAQRVRTAQEGQVLREANSQRTIDQRGITNAQRDRALDIAERGLGVRERGQQFREAHPPGGGAAWHAAQAELGNIEKEMARITGESELAAGDEALQVRDYAFHEDRVGRENPEQIRAGMLRTLGIEDLAGQLGIDDPRYGKLVDAAVKQWTKRRAMQIAGPRLQELDARRTQLRAVTNDAAGIEPDVNTDYLQGLRSILEAPDDDESAEPTPDDEGNE